MSRDPAVQTRVEWAPWPYYADDEREAVQRVLASGRVNYWNGQEGRSFEREYAEHLGRRHAVAVINGTVGLELALLSLGVGPGDEVITTPRTFIASASAAVARGAVPVLADVDRDSGNITARTIQEVMTPKTRAIIVVHLGGWPADLDPILELARERGVFVIEDAAQAHGALYHGRPVGAFGDVAAFSFCTDKIITTGGEGGMLAMDDEAVWNRAWSYKDHGKSYEAVYEREHPPGYRWLHESFGTNWRLPEMQSAIGRRQLGKLEGWVEARNRNADILRTYLEPLPAVRAPRPPTDVRHAYYRFYFYIEPEALRGDWSRDRIQTEVFDTGVPCMVGSCSEIYREVAFQRAGLGPSAPLPVAAELSGTALSMTVHPNLEQDSLHRAGQVLADTIRRATR
jgi:hypothetical protein